MLYKARTKSTELQIYESLKNRMNLSNKDKHYYLNLKKGYEGEITFDSLTSMLPCECFIINDLLLKMNNTIFQIDSLIITSETVYMFEVKNYEGDYFYELDKFFRKPKSEMINPLHQLSRSESLLHQLLFHHGFNLQIDASVVFINPGFTLYQAPLNKPIIFPTQINRYMDLLSKTPSKLNRKHKLLADKLISLHINDSPFKQLPSFDYNQLRKGIACLKCNSFSISVGRKKCLCNDCGYEESVETAVMRSIEEFRHLFPNKRITTNAIHDWCQVIPSKKRIRRILTDNFEASGIKRWAFYE